MFHFIKRLRTRLKYGISCCKSYSLYYYWAKQMRREITGFKKIADKRIDLKHENFGENIDKILIALDLIIEDNPYDKNWEERQKKMDEGLKLFAENFERFWW